MVEFENVSLEAGGKQVLKNISFTIEKGGFAAITGANGAGKTTLLKLFNGLYLPTGGRVLINGVDTKKTKTSELAKTAGFLFQNPDVQICKNTVREEIMFGLTCIGRDREYAKKRCESVIAEFGFDGGKAPFNMSRGERQRLALASVLAAEPELLLLDEPTTGLDYRECVFMLEYIRKMNEAGVTVVMVTHDMELVLDYAKTMLVLSGGELKAAGSMRSVMKNDGVLSGARLLPSQTAGLAMALGSGFEDVYTNEEMLEKLESMAGAKGAKGYEI